VYEHAKCYIYIIYIYSNNNKGRDSEVRTRAAPPNRQARLRRRFGDDPAALNGRLVVGPDADSVRAVARSHALSEAALLLLNRGHIPGLLSRSRLRAGTYLLLPAPPPPPPRRAAAATTRRCGACGAAGAGRLLPPWDERLEAAAAAAGTSSTGDGACGAAGACWRGAYGPALCGAAAAAAGAGDGLLGARVVVALAGFLVVGTVAAYLPLRPGRKPLRPAAADGKTDGGPGVEGLYRIVAEFGAGEAAAGGPCRVESLLAPLPCDEVTPRPGWAGLGCAGPGRTGPGRTGTGEACFSAWGACTARRREFRGLCGTCRRLQLMRLQLMRLQLMRLQLMRLQLMRLQMMRLQLMQVQLMRLQRMRLQLMRLQLMRLQMMRLQRMRLQLMWLQRMRLQVMRLQLMRGCGCSGCGCSGCGCS
jgi:hypothetical protein